MSNDRDDLMKLQSYVNDLSTLLDGAIEVLRSAQGLPGVDFMPLEQAMAEIAFKNEKPKPQTLSVEGKLVEKLPEGAPEFMRGTGGIGTEDAPK